ncbi:MAG TPA: phage major capsid protein [Acidimicrobiia bacterium]|nr:phage major capsid protein [Acidimicrobiia bacterium]
MPSDPSQSARYSPTVTAPASATRPEPTSASLESKDSEQASAAARWAVAAGDSDYATAFSKLLQHGPVNAPLTFTDRERAAFTRVAGIKNAMEIGTDTTGGFLLPTHLDPSVLLTSSGAVDPMRQISRVETIATDTWNGISSAGVTAQWLAESAEAADASPTIAEPSVPVHKGAAFIPFSFEFGNDAANGQDELVRLLVEGAGQLQATAYVTGSGTGQPTGIETALAGGASVVSPATAEVFASADVYATMAALPPRFRSRAVWLAELSTIFEIDKMETAAGAKLFPQVGQVDPILLNRRIHENSNVDAFADVDPAVTAANHILYAGDFARNFLIVDRVGSSIELIPQLFGTNRRPIGQRGLFLWFRTGSDSLVDEAFRVLNVATTL